MNKQLLRKGIILAGGQGSRLSPLTNGISKQLLPVYDKPMIYYPISTLMLAGIKEILIITTPYTNELFQKILGNGNQWGINFTYEIQNHPDGIAQAILIGETFLQNDPVVIALGDNIFHGSELVSLLHAANSREKGGTIFAYPVSDPERYGVVEFDNFGQVITIEEKPKYPASKYVIPGLYFYDNTVIDRVKKLKYSPRNELEITSLNINYLQDNLLKVEIMGRGMAWLDAGTFDSLQESSAYIRTLEARQGLKIGCPEEVAWRKGWINNEELTKLAQPLLASGYGKYLVKLL